MSIPLGYDWHGSLVCPQCRGDHLKRLPPVEIYTACGTVTDSPGVAFQWNFSDEYEADGLQGNPSPDGDGLRLTFCCKDCRSDLTMRIYSVGQHLRMDWETVWTPVTLPSRQPLTDPEPGLAPGGDDV